MTQNDDGSGVVNDASKPNPKPLPAREGEPDKGIFRFAQNGFER
jgi:hypothetical protein